MMRAAQHRNMSQRKNGITGHRGVPRLDGALVGLELSITQAFSREFAGMCSEPDPRRAADLSAINAP